MYVRTYVCIYIYIHAYLLSVTHDLSKYIASE